jgi:hypothetical protein
VFLQHLDHGESETGWNLIVIQPEISAWPLFKGLGGSKNYAKQVYYGWLNIQADFFYRNDKM